MFVKCLRKSLQLAKDQEDKMARKEAKSKQALELNALFKPVIEQKIAKGATILLSIESIIVLSDSRLRCCRC